MKIKIIDKGDGSEEIKEMTRKKLQERIKGTYVFPKTASEEFFYADMDKLETSFYIYEKVN